MAFIPANFIERMVNFDKEQTKFPQKIEEDTHRQPFDHSSDQI